MKYVGKGINNWCKKWFKSPQRFLRSSYISLDPCLHSPGKEDELKRFIWNLKKICNILFLLLIKSKSLIYSPGHMSSNPRSSGAWSWNHIKGGIFKIFKIVNIFKTFEIFEIFRIFKIFKIKINVWKKGKLNQNERSKQWMFERNPVDKM